MQATCRFIPAAAEEFPRWLAEIPNPPRGVFLSGRLPAQDALVLGIVGTRRASPSGKNMARDFAQAFARRGIVVVSGLAFGVDAAAHEGALDAGGQTIAVLPCGQGQIYPRSNEKLAARIMASGGALVTEYPPGTKPLPYRFLERNRIVSGLCRGVLVIEAPEKSGALVTARLAAEQGRDCFVIPGPVGNPHFIGSHQLIRKGAELVTCPRDIFEAYGLTEKMTAREETMETLRKRSGLSDDESKILHYLSRLTTTADIDKIITTVNLEPQAANIATSFLVIKGLIKEAAGGYMVS